MSCFLTYQGNHLFYPLLRRFFLLHSNSLQLWSTCPIHNCRYHFHPRKEQMMHRHPYKHEFRSGRQFFQLHTEGRVPFVQSNRLLCIAEWFLLVHEHQLSVPPVSACLSRNRTSQTIREDILSVSYTH